VVLQVSSYGELLTTAGVRAQKGLLLVGPHVYCHLLQHMDAFATVFCRAGEGAIISVSFDLVLEESWLYECLVTAFNCTLGLVFHLRKETRNFGLQVSRTNVDTFSIASVTFCCIWVAIIKLSCAYS
jgi:hypothetical protein